jgi:DNA-binding XRE family transcriptional regulator
MKRDKREKLERAGWKVGSMQEFLDLTDAETAVVEVRVSLARELRSRRRRQKISQSTLAKRLGSSQSRVAKMEAGDPSVSLDLLIRSLLRIGSTTEEIGRTIARAALA